MGEQLVTAKKQNKKNKAILGRTTLQNDYIFDSPSPPSCHGGGGVEARGVLYSLSHLKGKLHRIEQFWDIPYERLEDY